MSSSVLIRMGRLPELYLIHLVRLGGLILTPIGARVAGRVPTRKLGILIGAWLIILNIYRALASSVFFYLFLASPVDLTLLLGVTIGGILAAPLSTYTTKLKQERLKKFAGISIVLIGLTSLIWVLLNPTF